MKSSLFFLAHSFWVYVAACRVILSTAVVDILVRLTIGIHSWTFIFSFENINKLVLSNYANFDSVNGMAVTISSAA